MVNIKQPRKAAKKHRRKQSVESSRVEKRVAQDFHIATTRKTWRESARTTVIDHVLLRVVLRAPFRRKCDWTTLHQLSLGDTQYRSQSFSGNQERGTRKPRVGMVIIIRNSRPVFQKLAVLSPYISVTYASAAWDASIPGLIEPKDVPGFNDLPKRAQWIRDRVVQSVSIARSVCGRLKSLFDVNIRVVEGAKRGDSGDARDDAPSPLGKLRKEPPAKGVDITVFPLIGRMLVAYSEGLGNVLRDQLQAEGVELRGIPAISIKVPAISESSKSDATSEELRFQKRLSDALELLPISETGDKGSRDVGIGFVDTGIDLKMIPLPLTKLDFDYFDSAGQPMSGQTPFDSSGKRHGTRVVCKAIRVHPEIARSPLYMAAAVSDGPSSSVEAYGRLLGALELTISRENIAVVNLSIEANTLDDANPFAGIVRLAKDMHVILVAASGNSGGGLVSRLAVPDDVISVGALDALGEFWNRTGRRSHAVEKYNPNYVTDGVCRLDQNAFKVATSYAAPVVSAIVVSSRRYSRDPWDVLTHLSRQWTVTTGYHDGETRLIQ